MQLENGVGMLRLLIEETDYALEALSGDERAHTLSLATGKLAYPFLKDIAAKVHEKFPNVNITVYEILRFLRTWCYCVWFDHWTGFN